MMTFEQVVNILRSFHGTFYFQCSSALEKLFSAELWRGGEIRTVGGKLLALQVGHPNEWQLTPLYDQPDTGLIIDEPDEESEITHKFVEEVRFNMVIFVHPVYGPPSGTGEF